MRHLLLEIQATILALSAMLAVGFGLRPLAYFFYVCLAVTVFRWIIEKED